MNFLRIKKIIAGTAASVLMLVAAGVPTAFAQVSADVISVTGEKTAADTLSAAADDMREKMKQRQENFSVDLESGLVRSKADIEAIITGSFAETGDPKEGDYLRWSLESYGYSSSGYTENGVRGYRINFTVTYNTTAQQEAELDAEIERLIDELDLKGKSNYEIIRRVYNYAVYNISYSEDLSSRLIFSAYGAAVNKDAVCQGFAQLIYRLLTTMGVSCRIIPGTGNGGTHAWNIAELDGKYYFLDATWDSSVRSDEPLFFLRGLSDFDDLAYNNYHSLEWEHTAGSPLYADYDSSDFYARYPIAETSYVQPVYAIGDVNASGAVDASDASDVLAEYASLSTNGGSTFTQAQFTAADVDGSGFIDASDASYILMYYSFLSTGGKGGITEFIQNISR